MLKWKGWTAAMHCRREARNNLTCSLCQGTSIAAGIYKATLQGILYDNINCSIPWVFISVNWYFLAFVA